MQLLKLYIPILFVFHLNFIFSQDNLLIGEWQDHLPLRMSSWVTQSDEHIILSTGQSLIYIDKEELSYKPISKSDYLNNAEINLIKYDNANEQLIVIYKNGSFDIIKDESSELITSIKDNTSILGSKTINDFHITSQSKGYFATAFGIIEFDLLKREFNATTFTSVPVNAITSDEQFIYAALEDGMYYIEKENINKENFFNWKLFSSQNNLPLLYKCSNAEVFNNSLYIVVDNMIFKKENNANQFSKVEINIPQGYFVQWMSSEGQHLVIGLKDNESSSNPIFIDKSGKIFSGGANCINRTLYGIEDEKGRVWYADEWRFIRYTNTPTEGCNMIEYDSPFSYEASQIETDGDNVYVASGGATESYQIRFTASGLYIQEGNGQWQNINREFVPEIGQRNFLSVHTVCPHPTNKDLIYVGSYIDGFFTYKLSDKSLKFYGEKSNPQVNPTALQSIIGAPGQVRIPHMRFDKDENLWFANFGSPEPIVVLTKDSTWHAYDTPSDNGLLTRVAFDQNNNKWFSTFGPSSSIIVFNENNTFDDKSDDKLRVINSSNSLLNKQINCVEVDLNGSVWVGTSEGPVIFDCDPFDPDCEGSQIKVLEDSIPALLLQTEDILCIEIDGANRKWFGTRNGIFVQSANGENLEFRYTADNSPLFSDIVYDLEFHEEKGLMYISSSLGIQSLKTDAITGKNIHSSNVYTYPNPVRPNYSGPIAIKGLARDADVKITDINGRLVYKTKALGGQAIWNGNDYNGRKADTGTYLVFSASEQNPQVKDAIVTKILVVK